MALQDSSRVPPRKSNFGQSESANPWDAKSQENSLTSTGLENFEPIFHLSAEIISGEILHKGCQYEGGCLACQVVMFAEIG